ncbi:nucleic-acid-binding protein from transposon X-element [Nephila pilipes]|uniref:Nucleic-acid-binding protein from transposon X-element n=2 Tax=Nephila pilipes TaxID=299642 RepID=A0A8X6PU32_NEPPI|nr:nucleic-acid-binding protein from transposon X-element [Nephila pilipes]GFT81304.1 nucleic-acid-binding protein from transposon X-element [Nephila pilipes]
MNCSKKQCIETPTRKQYAPPITIDNTQNSLSLLKKLKEITKINLTGKLIGTSLRVYPQTSAAYHQIKSFVNQENLQHYTYQLSEDTLIRSEVIRGMTSDMPVQEILKDLDDLKIHADECHIMTNKRNNTPIPLFLVTLKRNGDNKDIFNLTEICSLKIEVEALRKKLDPAQCHGCQGFFHNSRFCGSNYHQCPMNPLNAQPKWIKTKNRQKKGLDSKLYSKKKNQSTRTNHPVCHTAPTSFAQAAATPVFPTPKEPTRIPYHNRGIPSTIDFAITKGLENTAIWTEPHLSSYHNPILITFHPQNLSKPTNIRLFTNCNKFQITLENSIIGNTIIETTEEIDRAISKFTEKNHHCHQPFQQGQEYPSSNCESLSKYPTKNTRKE